ncbi:hypothetical protein MLD38_034356 [Melastoma candidum]|uniref:Uncharacterized protein n=1 Tax=Melastoma candidum TaxID=119954 RepID=A0ACB9M9G0_9MYRT|nr:hypothetical protein MLD38_034356 [Melastoma candidum]
MYLCSNYRKGVKSYSLRSMRVPRKCTERCDNNRVLPILLKKTYPIRAMDKSLVDRMRKRTNQFVLHLRFEPDMLDFSGCYYGGGEKETRELGAIRKRWKTTCQETGKVSLTPEEIGLMSRALGYGSDVHIYVASGDIYGGEETLAPLKTLFPNFYTEQTIAT